MRAGLIEAIELVTGTACVAAHRAGECPRPFGPEQDGFHANPARVTFGTPLRRLQIALSGSLQIAPRDFHQILAHGTEAAFTRAVPAMADLAARFFHEWDFKCCARNHRAFASGRSAAGMNALSA